MVKQDLGTSGVQVSRVILGTMATGGHRDRAERVRIIRAAIDQGMTTLDTAPLYEFGRTEQIVAEAVHGQRANVQVLGKVGLRWDSDYGRVFLETTQGGRRIVVRRDSRPEAIRRDVDESLDRLGIEALDVCQVHHPDPDTPISDTMGALLELRREGKIRAIGVSNFDATQVEAARLALGDVPLASHQLEYSLLHRPPEGALLSQAGSLQLGVLAYSPLGRGALTAKLAKRGRLRLNDGRRKTTTFIRANARRIAAAIESTLVPTAVAYGVEVPQIALAWLLAQPFVTSVIAGASTVDQVLANARALDVKLRPDEVGAIGDSFANLWIDPDARPSLVERYSTMGHRWLAKVVAKVSRPLGDRTPT